MDLNGAVDVFFDISTDKNCFSGTHSIIVLSSLGKNSSKNVKKSVLLVALLLNWGKLGPGTHLA